MLTNKNVPEKVKISRLVTPTDIACGEEHAALVTDNQQIHTWGYGNDGQLGHGNKNSLNNPKQLKIEEKPIDCE